MLSEYLTGTTTSITQFWQCQDSDISLLLSNKVPCLSLSDLTFKKINQGSVQPIANEYFAHNWNFSNMSISDKYKPKYDSQIVFSQKWKYFSPHRRPTQYRSVSHSFAVFVSASAFISNHTWLLRWLYGTQNNQICHHPFL